MLATIFDEAGATKRFKVELGCLFFGLAGIGRVPEPEHAAREQRHKLTGLQDQSVIELPP